jgi:hypothetical protein
MGSSDGTTLSNNVSYKLAGACEANNFNVCYAGVLGTTVTSAAMPAVAANTFEIGQRNGTVVTGYIRQLMYLPRRMIDADLVTLTTP